MRPSRCSIRNTPRNSENPARELNFLIQNFQYRREKIVLHKKGMQVMGENNWTVRNIIKGKSILFTIITLILTKIFYEIGNKGLNLYLNKFNDHPLYTHNYSFGKYGLLLIIPAAIITIFILKLYARIRNVPYQNEVALSPARVKDLANNIISILTHKITKYVLLSVGLIIFIILVIEFTKAFFILFPIALIKKLLLRFTIMPAIALFFIIYIGSIILMASAAFDKKPMKTSSKYSARFGLLSLVFMFFGFGVIFTIPGIICSIFGIKYDHGLGKRVAVYGFLSSFIALLVLCSLAILGYLSITGEIQI